MANPWSVLEAMYRSELEALKTKIKMQALRMAGRAGTPANLIAATKGEAAAEVEDLAARASCGLSYGTIMPRNRTERM